MSCRLRFALRNNSSADSSSSRPPQNGRLRRHRRNLCPAFSVATCPPDPGPYGMTEARGPCAPRTPGSMSEALVGTVVLEVGVDLQAEPGELEGAGLGRVGRLLQLGDRDVARL